MEKLWINISSNTRKGSLSLAAIAVKVNILLGYYEPKAQLEFYL